MDRQDLADVMEDVLTEENEDLNKIAILREKMKIEDDDALCALYDLELLLFSRGFKSAMKVISCM